MKILFQGDSITDARRTDIGLEGFFGAGYVLLIKSHLEFSESAVTVINRGVGGNRITDLYARWKSDCLNLAPDVLTILIGVNDVWREADSQSGVDPKQFESVYRLLLNDTLNVHPKTQIILMGAYLLRGSVPEESEWGFDRFYDEVTKRAEIAEKLAREYQLPYIDLQSEFDRHITASMPASHWSEDGVHPTPAGHELIKRAWLECFQQLKGESKDGR